MNKNQSMTAAALTVAGLLTVVSLPPLPQSSHISTRRISVTN